MYVELLSHSNVNPVALISFSAKTCYSDIKPEMGDLMNIKDRIFEPGHHTTLEHFYLTYYIEDVSVSAVTFGLHLARNPFYNSDQRSGRFCSKMFTSPDYKQIKENLLGYWPFLNSEQLQDIIDFIKKGATIYQDNIEQATSISKKLIKQQRPFTNDKFIQRNAHKFAQEQLRVFNSTFFPTAITFTIDLTALIANYYSAWNPQIKRLTELMAQEVLQKWPELDYMFTRSTISDYILPIRNDTVQIKTEPRLKINHLLNESYIVYPEAHEVHPIDTLFFHPKFMPGNLFSLETEIEISTATMGQDHRHRTIDQGPVQFTGNFYMPPIVVECGLYDQALDYQKHWLQLMSSYRDDIVLALTPYGAMVSYIKKANFNALYHEMSKRLCWRAQEEIFNIARILRAKIIESKGQKSSLVKMFEPACIKTGICGEGKGYCGRDIKKDCFIKRKV